MRVATLVLPLLLALPSSTSPAAAAKGHLILIGGGEKPAAAMRRFVELAGGASAPIVVIPTASADPDVAAYYTKLFGELGARSVDVLPIRTREDASRGDLAEKLAKARGVFFAGGDQSRVTKALLDTPSGRALETAFADGAVVGGTSAGTACQSALMITGEGDFTVVRSGAVEVTRGLGLLTGAIVDQHFVARQRLNRLLTVILERPDLLGIGVDEDTAAWVRPDGTLEVIGGRSVVVLDAKGAGISRGGGVKPLLGVKGLALHVLLPGERFDLNRRVPLPAASDGPKESTR